MRILLRESFFQDGFPFYINRVAESFEMSQHAHDFIEINYVAEGKGAHHIGEESVPSVKGDVFFLPVGVSHVFRPSTPSRSRPFIVYNLLVVPEILERLGSVLPMPSPDRYHGEQAEWFRLKDADGHIHRLFTELHYEFVSKPKAYDTRMFGKFIELAGWLEHSQTHGEHSGAPKSEAQLFEEAVRYARSRLDQPRLSARNVAEHITVSESRLFRMFKKYTGDTFLTYLQQWRMEAACKWLRESEHKVQHISELCGYLDVKHFHRVFLKHTGVTPHRYRLASRSGERPNETV